jgi:flagellar biosynthesis protein FlhF
MIIKKFQGKTKEDALEAAQKELGDGLVEMNVKTVKAKGILGWLKKTMVEVTVAKEEESEKYERMEAVKQEKQLQPTQKPAPPKDILPEKAPDILKEPQNGLEEKLDNLQNLIEKQLSKQETKQGDEENDEDEEQDSADKGRINFLKLLYTKMTDNEIDEKYAHDIIEEIDKNCKPDMNMDMMLSEIYQRMILKLGKPYVIEESSQGPKVVFFVGPTGVGKTTTIAKIASSYRVERKKKVALLTADTYRIAAAEQLRTYANILEVPFRVVYTSKEIETAIEDFKEYDYILVDTTGHSPNNEAQRESMGSLINSVKTTAPKEVFLVLSASTKYRDLMNIADTYKEIADYKLIFTKVDETSTLGNIYNLKMYTGASLSYITCGQNVPDDIEYFNPQSTVKQLLGGRR